jgi:dephospho-CoA kinase
MLADLGAEVIDADRVAREVLDAGSAEVDAVVDRFGPSILRDDGAVDRPALGRIVFDDKQALADLEAIVHPATRKRILAQIAESRADVAVIEAIKLLEGPLVDHVKAVWVVTAPAPLRVDRLVEQRGLAREDAQQRVAAQNPEEAKVRRADVVLRNDGSLDDLRAQVLAAWRGIGSRM